MSSIAFEMATAAHSMFSSSSGRRPVSLTFSCVILTRDAEVSLFVAGGTVADGGGRAREDAGVVKSLLNLGRSLTLDQAQPDRHLKQV